MPRTWGKSYGGSYPQELTRSDMLKTLYVYGAHGATYIFLFSNYLVVAKVGRNNKTLDFQYNIKRSNNSRTTVVAIDPTIKSLPTSIPRNKLNRTLLFWITATIIGKGIILPTVQDANHWLELLEEHGWEVRSANVPPTVETPEFSLFRTMRWRNTGGQPRCRCGELAINVRGAEEDGTSILVCYRCAGKEIFGCFTRDRSRWKCLQCGRRLTPEAGVQTSFFCGDQCLRSAQECEYQSNQTVLVSVTVEALHRSYLNYFCLIALPNASECAQCQKPIRHNDRRYNGFCDERCIRKAFDDMLTQNGQSPPSVTEPIKMADIYAMLKRMFKILTKDLAPKWTTIIWAIWAVLCFLQSGSVVPPQLQFSVASPQLRFITNA
ncbi:hypothetical protein BC936DRAFT_138462 [Jimgerdemannia flammicorona]|uniref:Uncharacterized protein n=1 Tax=Jimgerdemannia flammicorona TaxID=994334 RepID=A0A433CE25_9FUNG|nr:hypothetical protein BC936DRAFT_138462 [Jimgerdemannia flammicorona]